MNIDKKTKILDYLPSVTNVVCERPINQSYIDPATPGLCEEIYHKSDKKHHCQGGIGIQ